METPCDDDLLPTVDAPWRDPSVGSRLPVNVPVSVELATFQRSAQSAVLLHRVYRQTSQISTLGAWSLTAETLDADIRMLLQAMTNQPYSWQLSSDPFALCLGALLVLYSHFLPSLETMHANSVILDSKTSQAFSAIAFSVQFLTDIFESEKHLQAEHPKLVAMSPSLTVCGFEVMKTLLRLDRIIQDAGLAFSEVRNAVQKYSQRWRIGGK
jgi:hypothetical protein